MDRFIPDFDKLLTQLGYDYNSSELRRSLAFKNALSSFVQQYSSTNGTKGSELNNWHTQKTEFAQMAVMFLDGHRQGDLFWPDDNKHPFANRLKYTTNYKQIHYVMAQLFYRYNNLHTLQRLEVSRPIETTPSQHADQVPSPRAAEQEKDIKVRYNIYYEDETRLNYHDWHPEPGFKPQSLDEFLCQVPGGEFAMGGRFVLSGLGFQVNRSVFDDEDLVRVMCEFDHWFVQCSAGFDEDMSIEDKMFTVDIYLEEHKPTASWIFSCKQN
ncbi:hypothetical protein GGI35DRAFT_483259 [Trichoderma velutinum]